MSEKAVLLFAGQGAQKVGMGKDLAENYPAAGNLLKRADEVLGFSLSDVMFNGPMEELTRTSRCQPALYVHGLMCLEVLKQKQPDLEISAAAGLSLGEFTAHAAAGTFTFEDGLKLVAKRGALMEEACEANGGSMAAMIGGDDESVQKLAEACNVDVANYNCPGQIVVSGSKDGVADAVAKAKDFGIRMGKELPVAGAYHSRLMQSAQDALAPELEATPMEEPTFPVICNVEASEVKSVDEIRRTLAAQVTGSVRWTGSMELLLERGEENFLELGPGGILAGMMNRIRKGTKVTPADSVEALEALG